ncbi:MAG: DUF1361 domain-containing protein [Flavobacteriales bacterium]
MVTALKENNRFKMSLLLAALSISCFSLSVFRLTLTNSPMYLFLNWNLFLAFLPWLFSSLLTVQPRWKSNKFIVLSFVGVWLLFFPNALYILTDLFHLHNGTAMPMWFDLVLVLAFAWTGLLFGFISLFDMEKILAQFIPNRFIQPVSVILLFAGSFGVYLGRFLRWNSWDVLQDPVPLLYDISNRFTDPFSHPRTWGVTLFVGALLCMIYFSLKMLKEEQRKQA